MKFQYLIVCTLYKYWKQSRFLICFVNCLHFMRNIISLNLSMDIRLLIGTPLKLLNFRLNGTHVIIQLWRQWKQWRQAVFKVGKPPINIVFFFNRVFNNGSYPIVFSINSSVTGYGCSRGFATHKILFIFAWHIFSDL